MPLKALAAEVFLSSPATAARIERLESEGIISGYSATVDHKKLGYPITAFINLERHPQTRPVFYPL
jgi:Lrp/AsnC family leucine-responsive transcriptional regulator